MTKGRPNRLCAASVWRHWLLVWMLVLSAIAAGGTDSFMGRVQTVLDPVTLRIADEGVGRRVRLDGVTSSNSDADVLRRIERFIEQKTLGRPVTVKVRNTDQSETITGEVFFSDGRNLSLELAREGLLEVRPGFFRNEDSAPKTPREFQGIAASVLAWNVIKVVRPGSAEIVRLADIELRNSDPDLLERAYTRMVYDTLNKQVTVLIEGKDRDGLLFGRVRLADSTTLNDTLVEDGYARARPEQYRTEKTGLGKPPVITGRVLSVSEWNTFRIMHAGKPHVVHLYGIEIPNGKPEAIPPTRVLVAERLLGKVVTVRVLEWGRQNSILGEVVLADRGSLNAELLKNGLAAAISGLPGSRGEHFTDMETLAKTAKIGLWAEPPPPPPKAAPAAAAPSATQAATGETAVPSEQATGTTTETR
ncbi:MAG: thermonuclease family protein [Candidatus Hydrogenedentes bacterium]|nr:thermonuclease family protein [Candidatus Hydrogenedentota bacterium]